MILMDLGHHSLHVKPRIERKTLSFSQNVFRPFSFIIIRDNDYSFSTIPDGLHPSSNKQFYTLPTIVLAPRRVCVEALKSTRIGKRVDTIVQMGS